MTSGPAAIAERQTKKRNSTALHAIIGFANTAGALGWKGIDLRAGLEEE